MAGSSTVVIPPSLPRLLTSLLVGGLGVVGGLLLIFGAGRVWVAISSAVGGLIIFNFVVAAVRQRPRVVITPEGFTAYKLFGEESRKWGEVHGEFAVFKNGWLKGVGYNLAAGHEARIGSKPGARFSGYDAAVGGALALTAEQLAELLNARARRAEGSTRPGQEA